MSRSRKAVDPGAGSTARSGRSQHGCKVLNQRDVVAVRVPSDPSDVRRGQAERRNEARRAALHSSAETVRRS